MLVRLAVWLISARPAIRWLFIVGCVFFGGQVGSIVGLSGVLKIIIGNTLLRRRGWRSNVITAARALAVRNVRKVLSEETFWGPLAFEIRKMLCRSKEDIRSVQACWTLTRVVSVAGLRKGQSNS